MKHKKVKILPSLILKVARNNSIKGCAGNSFFENMSFETFKTHTFKICREPDENRKRTSQTGPTLYISRVLAHSGWRRASHQIEDINVFPLKFGRNGETTWKIAKYCPVLF